ncbi:tRNA-dihydrouridine(47) synthase [NAD(P)(+)]-like [Halyomorpha halys]|uniref:tRNA-dihydrouridine(47) synthase [NAD(P)(+)]-like n=1 Tax=Halyomorpha halys TaxID=286706 RepID=UPI0006D4D248|nr:tRNA-dihydrouridine(47) synthase [NAD(P)(+)]-like [Halyomorpha halys]
MEAEEGVAQIKPEYIITNHERSLCYTCISENDKRKLDEEEVEEQEVPHKKKKLTGQNKARNVFRPSKDNFCHAVAASVDESQEKCENDNCKFSHDRKSYFENKPPDIGDTCYLYSVQGLCSRGVTCRFGKEHLTENGVNIVNKELHEKWLQNSNKTATSTTSFTKETQNLLRKKKYDFSRSEEAIKEINKLKGKETSGPVDDLHYVKLRPQEMKKIDWRDKLYLSPLTTVGNLPFRRLCVDFGADVTCGEMALATPLLQGSLSEWALVKRHPSEKIFGAQLCGSNVNMLTKAAQVVEDMADVDFIDINLGCPIEFIYRQGGGSGLLLRGHVLKSAVRSMSYMLNVPLTVKTRSGCVIGKNIAHNFMPMFRDAGVSLITVHGRTREQRYTKNADWDYIQECAAAAKPTSVFGNGDILSYEDYMAAREKAPDVAGVMIGRGALIKPWIFQEIKERRILDPSSSERFGYLKTYVNYGLEHWGSDTKGVETTRRFLLEWLSFCHRYIPTGLLVNPPQKVNQRPPFYAGRDDLETLFASSNSGDWIKISEMLLGPVPEGFTFLPKHKANAWK